MGEFSSNKSGDMCQSGALHDVSGSPLVPRSSRTLNHSLWDYCNRILLYKLWPCVLLPRSLATHYGLSKRAIARKRDTERRREAIDLCVLHICLASPSTPILRVKSSDPKLTVNRRVMVAKPADINQSDFLLVYHRRLPPPFARSYHLTQLLSCFWSLKNLIMVKCVSQTFTDAS